MSSEPLARPASSAHPPSHRGGVLGAAAVGMASTAVSAVAALVRAKPVALSLGPIGVGYIAEVQQLVNLLFVPISVLGGAALTKTLVTAQQADGTRGLREQTRRATSAVIALTFIAGIGAVLASTSVLPSSSGVRTTVALAAGGSAVAALLGVYTQVLLVTGYIRDSALVTGLSTVAGTLVAVACIWRFGADGLFFGLLLGPILALPFALKRVVSRVTPGHWRPRVAFDVPYLKMAIRVGGASFAGSAATQLALSSVRAALLRDGGHQLNGLFQSAWALDSLFTASLTAGMASFFFPKFAAARSPEALSEVVDHATEFLRRISIPAVLTFLSLREILLFTAYSSEFAEAELLLGLLTAGDALKLLGWVRAAPLLYGARVRAYLVAELTAAATLATISVLAIPAWGLVGVGIAQVSMYAVYLPTTTLLLRRVTGVAAPIRPAVRHLLLAIVALILALLTSRWPWANVLCLLAAGVAAFEGGFAHAVFALLRQKQRDHRHGDSSS